MIEYDPFEGFSGDNPLIRTPVLGVREQAALATTNPSLMLAYRPPATTAPATESSAPDNPLAVRPKLPTPIPVPVPTYAPTSPSAPPPMMREVAPAVRPFPVVLSRPTEIYTAPAVIPIPVPMPQTEMPVAVIPPAKPIVSARVADPTVRQVQQRIVDSGSSASAAAVADTAEPLYPTTMTPPPDEKKAGFPWWLLLVVAYAATRRKK